MSSEVADESGRKVHFERVFEDEDPWLYDEPYEALKYEQTLGLLGDRTYSSALEAGCAEGHFTRRVADRCGEVLALDISPTAVRRAAQRFADAGVDHVAVAECDLVLDDLPGTAELVVCSETLYFMPTRDDLGRALRKLANAVLPGGDLLMAHAFDAGLGVGKSGFGWRMTIDAETISEEMAAIDGITLAHRFDTELYRIERYRKGPSTSGGPVVEFVPIDRGALEPKISMMALWNGYGTTPGDASKDVTDAVPVLMYHSVANDGPPELRPYRVTPEDLADQCEFLRFHGYRSLNPQELINHVLRGKVPEGRRVMFTFDDAYEDFELNALPILEGYGFYGPLVFVPTAHIGGEADWDDAHQHPPKIISADHVKRLARRGVFFGSHGHRHEKMVDAEPTQLGQDLAASRALLQDLSGQRVATLAYPFGSHDGPAIEAVRSAGFELAFGTASGLARHGDPPMKLQRIFVDGSQSSPTSFAEGVPLLAGLLG